MTDQNNFDMNNNTDKVDEVVANADKVIEEAAANNAQSSSAPQPQYQPPQYTQPQYNPPQYQTNNQQYQAPRYPQPPYGQQVPPPQYGGMPPQPYMRKSMVLAGILGLLFGSLGVHNFYLGFNTKAIIQIVVTFVTCGVGSLWGFIEGIIILCGRYNNNCDANGVPMKE